MVGNPAKQIGWMSKAGGRLDKKLICPIDGTKYELNNENILREKEE